MPRILHVALSSLFLLGAINGVVTDPSAIPTQMQAEMPRLYKEAEEVQAFSGPRFTHDRMPARLLVNSARTQAPRLEMIHIPLTAHTGSPLQDGST